MANQVLNSARRHFMAGSGGIALCAGLPLGASAQLPHGTRVAQKSSCFS
jgi:hypothetical protein